MTINALQWYLALDFQVASLTRCSSQDVDEQKYNGIRTGNVNETKHGLHTLPWLSPRAPFLANPVFGALPGMSHCSMEAIHHRNVPSLGFIHPRSGVSPRSCFPPPLNLKLKERLPLPLGPTVSPHGNSLGAGRSSPQQIQQWIEQYGPVITLTNGDDIRIIIAHKCVGDKVSAGSGTSHGEAGGRNPHLELQMKATLIYDNDQTQYARKIVWDVLKELESHQGHIKRFSATMTPGDIWKDDPDGALMPGAYKVDKYPFLKYVPGYTLELDKWENLEHEQFINNVRQTKRGLEDHTGRHSVAGGLLSNTTGKAKLGLGQNVAGIKCG
ncbi:hypothetical protein BU15DRAFT_59948 [Melanogaster broomeanus]|nr:hypothetical protein BU15DRAFT_69522 [Melanogaster broomeanus]KAF9243069.1 hypothetical protein BU15DRAFT_59948 [Melanogaster broomeanus]